MLWPEANVTGPTQPCTENAGEAETCSDCMVTEPAFGLVSVTVAETGLPTTAADPKLTAFGLAVSELIISELAAVDVPPA